MKKSPSSAKYKGIKDSGAERVLVIPNIRSAHNVGSLFRSADGAGFSRIYLCGYSPTPIDKFGRHGKPQKEIAKTALGAEQAIPYEYTPTLKEAVKKLKKSGFMILGLEQDEKSIKMGSLVQNLLFKKTLRSSNRIALVVGEEVNGMTKIDRKLMDHMLELPMLGQKESLNVSVAGGIAMYMIAMTK